MCYKLQKPLMGSQKSCLLFVIVPFSFAGIWFFALVLSSENGHDLFIPLAWLPTFRQPCYGGSIKYNARNHIEDLIIVLFSMTSLSNLYFQILCTLQKNWKWWNSRYIIAFIGASLSTQLNEQLISKPPLVKCHSCDIQSNLIHIFLLHTYAQHTVWECSGYLHCFACVQASVSN